VRRPSRRLCGVEADARVISPDVVYCGKSGYGKVACLINDALAACTCLLTYEAAASVALKYGLKLADILLVVNKSTGWSSASERIQPTLSKGTATANNPPRLMVKDLEADKMHGHQVWSTDADRKCGMQPVREGGTHVGCGCGY